MLVQSWWAPRNAVSKKSNCIIFFSAKAAAAAQGRRRCARTRERARVFLFLLQEHAPYSKQRHARQQRECSLSGILRAESLSLSSADKKLAGCSLPAPSSKAATLPSVSPLPAFWGVRLQNVSRPERRLVRPANKVWRGQQLPLCVRVGSGGARKALGSLAGKHPRKSWLCDCLDAVGALRRQGAAPPPAPL